MKNETIREAAKKSGVKLWQIAEHLGMNDGNLSRKLRRELPKEEQSRIVAIIKEIEKENEK